MMKSSKAKVGGKAPAFNLPDQNEKTHSLTDYAGGWLLIYFYPKDDTPGCTKEACTIRDSWTNFENESISVIGVSTDDVKSHKKFATKHKLPFELLADTEKKMVNAYGVWGEKTFMGKTYMGTKRTSFLIDPDGKIAKIYQDVKPIEHASEILNDHKELTS